MTRSRDATEVDSLIRSLKLNVPSMLRRVESVRAKHEAQDPENQGQQHEVSPELCHNHRVFLAHKPPGSAAPIRLISYHPSMRFMSGDRMKTQSVSGPFSTPSILFGTGGRTHCDRCQSLAEVGMSMLNCSALGPNNLRPRSWAMLPLTREFAPWITICMNSHDN